MSGDKIKPNSLATKCYCEGWFK